MVETLVDTARRYENFTASHASGSIFASKVGYPGSPWAGAFIDVVARIAKVKMPACVYPPSALAEFTKANRMRKNPKPGDIVFFSFPSETVSKTPHFAAPHVGIVTKTDDWQLYKTFETIEGQVNNQVKMCRRYGHDVIGFARPKKERRFMIPRPEKPVVAIPRLSFPHVLSTKNSSTKIYAVSIIQLALHEVTGLRCVTPGTWDDQTRAAFARWQRAIGFVGFDANGKPGFEALQRLATDTKLFTITL